MAARKYKMVRLQEKTWIRLQAMRSLLIRQLHEGRLPDVCLDERFEITLDSVLAVLLDRDDGHRARSLKAAKEKAKKTLAEIEEKAPPQA